MDKIAREPWADWLGGWLPDVHQYVRWFIDTRLRPTGSTAFFAIYNLPYRDCSGQYSSGGATTADEYRGWVDSIASALGSWPSIVVVEPDGLPDSKCLTAAHRAERLSLESYAVHTLAGLPHTAVYLDAGRSDWRKAGDMVRLLRGADVREARGFSLDVTGYATTGHELAYGHQIGAALGGKHFIVNTSRNGVGPLPRSRVRSFTDEWCNQPGALGPRPTTRTRDPLADAYEWILHPGYSDGPCHGGPPAGTWWPAYALGLARRARY